MHHSSMAYQMPPSDLLALKNHVRYLCMTETILSTSLHDLCLVPFHAAIKASMTRSERAFQLRSFFC